MTNLRPPAGLRGIAVAAALAACLAVIHSTGHSHHDDECSRDACAVCLFSDPGSAASDYSPRAAAQFSESSSGPARSATPGASRPFAAARPRAPPIA